MSRPATDTAAWELLDRLRPMPQPLSAHVVPLAVMIYLRWADFQEAEAEAMAAFDDSDYTPLLPASLHWRCWHELVVSELPGFFSQRLASELAKLGGSHDPLAASLFRLVPALRFMREISPAGLAALAGWLAAQLFETPYDRRMLLEHFDAFVDASVSRESGEFRTPANINELLVALAHPASGERLYDPCFGFGGILTAACQNVSRTEKSNFTRNGAPDLQIAGMDINLNAFAVTLARLALMGVATPQLEIGNSLERGSPKSPGKEGYDLVITNPPWGKRVEIRGMDHYPILTNDGTSLFVQHSLSQLRPNGRAIIVVPQGFLFQQGKTAAVREWLLKNHRVDAVIGLPSGTFLPYAGVVASILVVHRNGGPTQSVRMIDGAAFFKPGKGRGKPTTIERDKIEELASAAITKHADPNSWDVDAEMIAELGFDLSPTRREVSEFDELMESLGELVSVRSIKEVCEISAGRAIPSSNLSDEPIGENPIPYLRIGDIEKGQTAKAKSWLNLAAIHELAPRHRLRAGDILLSKSGTIGKTGVARNGAIGGVASGGLMVLHPDPNEVDPHYLSAILRSKVYQQWFKSKSSGSVISGLQKSFIESLLIPLPPLQIQHRIASEVKERELDAIRQLLFVLRLQDNHPLSEWADGGLSFLTDADNRSEAHTISLQEIVHFLFGSDFRNVRNEVAHPKLPSSDLDLNWVLAMWQVAENLRNLSTVPEGPSRFSLLQRAEYELRSVRDQITGDSPTESKAREIAHRLGAILSSQRETLLVKVAVSIDLKTESLQAGTRGEIALAITNDGALPLHNFTLKCSEWALDLPSFYLPENDLREIAFEVDAPKEPGDRQLRFEWSATSLEGQPESGLITLVVKVERSAELVTVIDLGPSPYFVSEPVSQKRTDIFVGREETISRIKHQLASGNTVLLEGNRRAGKTSILKQIEGLDHIQDRLAVYASLQATEGDSEVAGMRSEAVWRTLAKSIISGVATLEIDVPLPDGTVLVKGAGVGIARACRKGISSEAPWEDFLEYATLVMNLLAERGLGLVLMIDEFDKLQEGIDNKVTSPQIPENIRYLIQNLPGFSAILTGSRRMQRLRHEYWSALYGLGKQVGVTALEPDAARRLIQKPVEGRLTYTHEAVELLIDLTARQPFLIQSLCNQVFELAVEQQLRSITATTVNEAANRFVEHNEHFASLWDYAETDRRRFILALCNREAGSSDPLTFGVLKERLGAEGVEVSDTDLDYDIKYLQELELIDYTGTDGGEIYQLTVPLMGQWIDAQQDYHAVRAKALTGQQDQMPHNVYLCSSPIGPDRDDIFYGRKELLNNIRQQIQSKNCVILEGTRRSGKTSVIKHLEGDGSIPGWLSVPVNVIFIEDDAMGQGFTSAALCRNLARHIAAELKSLNISTPLPDGTTLEIGGNTRLIAKACRDGISVDQPWNDLENYLKQILHLLDQRGLGLVVIFDEFDRLLESIDAGASSPEILDGIRSLFESQNQLVVLMACSPGMNRIQNQSWAALRGLAKRIEINSLDKESAQRLITEPLKGRLHYSDDAVKSIFELTAGQPFLIQMLCRRIVDHADMRRSRSVDADLVREVAHEFVDDNEHFPSLWDYAVTDQRRFLIDICHRHSAGPDPVTFGFLQQQLANEGIEISDGDLDDDLKFLQELEIIDFAGVDGGGVYRLTVPLMGQWIDQQQDYAALRDKARKEQENTQ
jgi:type I restriction enzyme M protein